MKQIEPAGKEIIPKTLVWDKSHRKQLTLVADTDQWLQEMQSGKYLFENPVAKELRQKMNSSRDFLKGIPFKLFSGFIFVPAALAAGVAIPELNHFLTMLDSSGHDIAMIAVWLGTGLVPTVAVSSLWNLFTHGKKKELWKNGEFHANLMKQGLRDWLLGRYSITVSDTNYEKLFANFLGPYFPAHSNLRFEDVNGDWWELRVKANTEQWYVESLRDSYKEADLNLHAYTFEGLQDADLPDEASALYASAQERLLKLRSFNSHIETDHNALRIAEDAKAIVSSFQKLRILGQEEAGKEQLINVLSSLNTELQDVIEREAAAIQKEMSAQEMYVHSRQELNALPVTPAIEQLPSKLDA